ncbi:Rieske (2Fe-2S) protein [Streptomyces sp. ML-6]|uniref:Rieske (2Fe-2S) protein n=1 Tax=Streptomyces sp. ML-6 TaxID=2982693 RepID=UPI0024BF25B2|nr:Rieske (2Fe-2S) protein [Streptomyces sp. ML-6]MDK0518255.1 Rieske (2Fe-2S) protein [Streptomyces sp. ML-6]
MSASQEPGEGSGRRAVVMAFGAAPLAAVLAACGGREESGGSDVVKPSDGGTDSGVVLATTADIPENGGKVFADRGVVVTRPKADEFKAFSSKCTHQGCTVSSVSDGTVNCSCHGSRFDAASGAVVHGPATEPLPAKKIAVTDGSITLLS